MPVLWPQSPATAAREAAREERAQRLFEESIEEDVRQETVQNCLEEIVSKLENMRLEPFQTRSQGTQTTADLPSVVPKPTPASIVTGYLEDGNTMLTSTIMKTLIDYPYYSLCASDVQDLLQCGANPALRDATMVMTPLMHACIPVYRRTEYDWNAPGEYSVDISLIDTLLADPGVVDTINEDHVGHGTALHMSIFRVWVRGNPYADIRREPLSQFGFPNTDRPWMEDHWWFEMVDWRGGDVPHFKYDLNEDPWFIKATKVNETMMPVVERLLAAGANPTMPCCENGMCVLDRLKLLSNSYSDHDFRKEGSTRTFRVNVKVVMTMIAMMEGHLPLSVKHDLRPHADVIRQARMASNAQQALIILGLDNVPSTKQGVYEAFQSTRRSYEDVQKKRRLEGTKGTGGYWEDEAGPVTTWSKLEWAKEVLIEFISDNAKRQVSQSAQQGQPQIGAGQSDAMDTTLMLKNARKLKGRDCEECGRSWADVHGQKARSNRPPVTHGRQRFVDLQFLSTRGSINDDLQACYQLKDQTIDNQAYELTKACRAIAPAFQKNGDGQSAPEWICPDCYVKAIDKLLTKTTENMPEVD